MPAAKGVVVPIAVTRCWYEGKRSGAPEYTVTIVLQRDGDHRVRLDHGEAVGIWRTGLVAGDIPRADELRYLEKRFFNGAAVVNTRSARIYNSLYLDALRALETEAARARRAGGST